MLSRESAQPVGCECCRKSIQVFTAQKWWKLEVFKVTFCLIAFRYGKMHLISDLSNGEALLSYHRRSRCSKFSNGDDVTHIWKHCRQPTRQLWYDGREACARCNLLQGSQTETTKMIKFYVLQFTIKEVFRTRSIQPCTSPYTGSSVWMVGGDFKTDKCRVK